MLRPLPRVVAPFGDETITSYLHRLAGPNHIDPAGLRSLLARSHRKDAPVPLSLLAAVTGISCQLLGRAMPQICTAAELSGLHVRDRPRARPGWAFPACRACAAGGSRSPGGRCTTTSCATGTAAGSAKTASRPISPGSRRSCTHTGGTGG